MNQVSYYYFANTGGTVNFNFGDVNPEIVWPTQDTALQGAKAIPTNAGYEFVN